MIAGSGGAARRTRFVALAASVLVLAGGVAACSSSSGSSGSPSGNSGSGAASKSGGATPTKVLRYGVDASNLTTGVSDPAKIQHTDGPVLSIAYASLFHADPDGKIVAGLATKWNYVGGKKVFEFTLRQDARFSDGTPVTAAAVVGSLNYYYKSKNVYSSLLGQDPVFAAIGKWQVRITMKAPLPNLPFLLSEANVNWGFVVAPKATANPDLLTKGTYGAGPYKLDYAHSVPGDHYTFVPNPYYYDKSAIKFKQIYLKGFKDASSAIQAQEAGQIDVNWTTDSSAAPAADKAGLQVVNAPFAVSYATLHGAASKPLSDVRVRQAMNYALDRKAIANALYGKYGAPSSQFTIPPDSNPGLENYYSYDTKKAHSLLAAAGYPNGFSFKIATSEPPKAAQLIAHYLDAVGIKTKIKTFSTSAAYLKVALSAKNDSALFAGDVGTPTTIEYPSYLAPGSQLAIGNPDNPKVDELYKQGLSASDPSVPWKQMWAITVKDAWFLPLASSSDMAFVSKSVGGVQMSKGRPYPMPMEWFFK